METATFEFLMHHHAVSENPSVRPQWRNALECTLAMTEEDPLRLCERRQQLFDQGLSPEEWIGHACRFKKYEALDLWPEDVVVDWGKKLKTSNTIMEPMSLALFVALHSPHTSIFEWAIQHGLDVTKNFDFSPLFLNFSD